MDSILIPVKRLDRAKHRLAPRVSADNRRRLGLAMLTDVLNATSSWRHRLVVTSDPLVAALGKELSCVVIEDPGPDLNAAVAAGTAAAVEIGCDRLMVLAADVPLLTADAVVEIFSFPERVVIAPSTDGGTNVLVRRPPMAVPPAYGPASAEAHRKLAHAAGLEVRTIESSRTMLDVDHFDDLVALVEVGGAGATIDLARRLLEAGGDEAFNFTETKARLRWRE